MTEPAAPLLPKSLPVASASTPLERWLNRVGQDTAFGGLLDANPQIAVFAVDAEQKIVAWSKGAERLLGYRAEEVIGEHCLKANRCSQCIAECGLKLHGNIEGGFIELYDRAGRLVAFKKYTRVFHDAGGAFLGGVEMLVPTSLQTVQDAGELERRAESETFHGIITGDAAMKSMIEVVRSVAVSDVSVLVRGESGTGKELVARAIHEESHRKDKPFVAVNCAAFTPSLLESTLFGHEKGAFTGAIRTHHGVFEQANGGTLFLDEVAELPLELQASMLRVLQEQTFTRVGGLRPIQTDVRVISATHRSLREAVRKGNFREDLMFRLRVVPIFIPPLRERQRDIPLLAEHFLDEIAARARKPRRILTADANRALLQHRWSGNARELRNALEYACAVGRSAEIELGDLPPELRESVEGAPLSLAAPARRGATTAEEEAAAIRQALEEAGGHVGKAAAALGMSRPTFWRRRKKYGI